MCRHEAGGGQHDVMLGQGTQAVTQATDRVPDLQADLRQLPLVTDYN